MPAWTRLAAVTALMALNVSPSAQAAKPKPITGTLSKRGYTVIALAANGRATAVKARPAFRLVPPARSVTLHLRGPKGRYAGPLVLGGTRTRAIVGVRHGTALGSIAIRSGYARPRRAPRARRLVTTRTARARRGVPIGAGKLGLVATRASGRAGVGRDQDLDGLPGAFDVDDDGDRILDNVDRPGARASLHDPAGNRLHPFWVINAGLEVSYIADDRGATQGAAGYALNRSAAGPFAADADFLKLRDLMMKERGALLFPLPGAAAQLNCGDRTTGLPYCRPTGTGAFLTRNRKFPEQFDSDNNGFGSLEPVPAFAEGQDGLGTLQSVSPSSVFGLAPMAGGDAIGSGDTFVELITGQLPLTVTLNTVFETVPALAAWSDGGALQPIAYPVPRGGAGSESNGFELNPSAGGDYVLGLSMFRPQRRAIGPEGTGWIDVGGLRYTVVGKTVEQNRRVWRCPDSAYSAAGGAVTVGAGGVFDNGASKPTSPANTFAFAVNISACLRASGLGDWKPSDPPSDVFVSAHSAWGDAAEGGGFAFRPKGPGPGAEAFRGTWRFVDAGKTEIEWTARATGAETSDVGPLTYPPRSITGGTPPGGWTCGVESLGGNNWYHCTGNTLHSGETITGRATLSSPGQDNMSIDLIACAPANNCKGYGMTQTP